jgi:class 3 adenylate cyclase
MPSATVTILFTDLVSSTELLTRAGEERAEELWREHYEMLRTAIAANAGREVKTLGDGLMVAFDSVVAGVSCAVAMQQAMHARNRRAAEPLAMKIGISCGEADFVDNDYFGVAVVEGARLCAKAGGDQILATEIVRLLAGSRGGFDFVSLGPLQLKGIDTPVATHEVRWSPLTTGSAVPLPARLRQAEGAIFVGRVAQQELLQDALKQADVAEHQRVILLSGEAGIGKTTLVATLAREAHAAGAIVLYGRCDEDLARPYQPWVEALTHLVEHAPEDILRAHVQQRDGDLARLIPALTRRLPDLPANRPSDPDSERHLLFAAVVDLLARASEDSSVVVVLDDLHWADRTTVQLLRHVAAAATTMRLLVLGTFRETDVDAAHPLTEVLAALHREPAVERVMVEGLDDRELLALMEQLAGGDFGQSVSELRDELREETNGNPFFVTEIFRHLIETGGMTTGPDGARQLRATGLPVSVREVVGRRVHRLGERASHVLSVAAVIGRDFDFPLLARVVDISEDELLDVLDEAANAFVISEAPATVDQYTFVHALIQRTLYDDLSAARRRRLHRQVGAALEVFPNSQATRIGELARHFFEAANPEDARKAYAYAIAAGDDAQDRLAPDEAARWFSQALELVDRTESAPRCDTLIRLGSAQRLAGIPAFRETLLDAAALAREGGDTEKLVASALANTRGFQSSAGQVDVQRIEVLQAALSAVADASAAQRGRLLALLAIESFWAPDADVDALLDEALRLTAGGEDVGARLFVLRAAQVWMLPHNLERRRELLEEEGQLVRLADPVRRAWYESERTQVAYQEGDAANIRTTLATWYDAVEQVGDPALIWAGKFAAAMVASLWDDLATVEEMLDDVLHYGVDTGQPDAFSLYAAQLAALRTYQGRAAEICDVVAEVSAANPLIPGFRAVLAGLYAAVGRDDESRAILDEFSASKVAHVRADLAWGSLVLALAQAAGLVGHAEIAAQLMPLAEPIRDKWAYSGVTIDGPFALVIAIGNRLLGAHDAAEAAFRETSQMCERLESPYWTALTKVEWARCRLAANRDASELLSEVINVARERGYRDLERQAQSLAADHA